MRAIDISINTNNNMLDSPKFPVPKLIYNSHPNTAKAIARGSTGLGHIKIKTPSATNAPYHKLYASIPGKYESAQANIPVFLYVTAAFKSLIVFGYIKYIAIASRIRNGQMFCMCTVYNKGRTFGAAFIFHLLIIIVLLGRQCGHLWLQSLSHLGVHS